MHPSPLFNLTFFLLAAHCKQQVGRAVKQCLAQSKSESKYSFTAETSEAQNLFYPCGWQPDVLQISLITLCSTCFSVCSAHSIRATHAVPHLLSPSCGWVKLKPNKCIWCVSLLLLQTERAQSNMSLLHKHLLLEFLWSNSKTVIFYTLCRTDQSSSGMQRLCPPFCFIIIKTRK